MNATPYTSRLLRTQAIAYRRFQEVPLRMIGRSQIKWLLLFGPTRCGTSLMLDMVQSGALRTVGDWNLGQLLQATQSDSYVEFDRQRALRDIGRNVLLNAFQGSGTTLDLAYKQANLSPQEHLALVDMWGPPGDQIFCLREPTGYMRSARRKWPNATPEDLTVSYLNTLRDYEAIGGRIFEYSRAVTRQDYITFLANIIPVRRIERFGPLVNYRAPTTNIDVPAELNEGYRAFVARYHAQIWPPVAQAERAEALPNSEAIRAL